LPRIERIAAAEIKTIAMRARLHPASLVTIHGGRNPGVVIPLGKVVSPPAKVW
jgi:hypothetical protein